MKLKLISPSANRFTEPGASRFHFPPLSLAVLAAHTPDEFEITIIDETSQELLLEDHLDADLIAISAFTSNVKRGYEIADLYRSRNIPVVMGGHHVSALPDEALQHASAIVIGEAELVWQQVLEDCKEGKLEGIYQAKEHHDMKGMPFARIDLYPKEVNYLIRPNIHITRGCPHNCSFCSVSVFAGRKIRKRPIDEIIAELKHIKENYTDETNRFVFNDDNFTTNKRFSKELFKKMIPLGMKWQAFAGMDIAKDDEFLKLCKAAGCLGLFIGFDALNKEDLSEVNKGVNKEHDYAMWVHKVQEEYGIPVIAGLMVGFDHDNVESFEAIANFIEESRCVTFSFNILYPYPGTRIFKKLEAEDRITSYDWDNYVMDGVNFIPAKMTQDELHEGYLEILRRFSTDEAIEKRADHALKTPMGQSGAEMIWHWGRGIQRQYQECLRGENKVRRP